MDDRYIFHWKELPFDGAYYLAEELYSARRQKKLSLEEVSRATGIPPVRIDAQEVMSADIDFHIIARLLDFYRIAEVFHKETVDKEQIAERRHGYLYFNKRILVEKQGNEINEFLNSNHIALLEDEETTLGDSGQLMGTSAFGGKIKGVVSIIVNEKDFCKMKKGDILVASMTVPKFLPVMKIAGAMVTDEGGVLCHAAIVARELEIPTVIGTKRATSVLTDGDLVEVDANNGKVRILVKGYRI